MLDKSELRQIMRKQRQLITLDYQQKAQQALVDNLQPLIASSQRIAIYHACAGELSLAKCIEYCLSLGKQLFMPIAYRENRLMRCLPLINNYSTQVFFPLDYPLIDEIQWYNIDLILIPLLAIDSHGIRLGQGGGYYDSTLATVKPRPVLCGIGYANQLVDNLPKDPWDLQLDFFATEKSLIKFS
ncbi:MAG: hypothetical protein RLZZ293_427 [Pseudomonadota bacterium]|jgi:5-formyltetrahydrofolate cyclo-ligase